MKITKRALQATETTSTSGSEGEVDTRTYAAVVAQPGSNTVPTQGTGTLQPPEGRQVPPPGPPGPPRAEERRSPSPVAGSSGLQPPAARSAKKRKRAGTPPTGRGGGKEEVPDSEVRKTNAILKTEMANLSSRAVSLQTTLEEYQEGLEESTNLLSLAKIKEDELRAEHSREMKIAIDRMNEMKDAENRRALASYYKTSARYRARKSNKDIIKSSLDLIIKCMLDMIQSFIVPKKNKIKKSGKTLKIGINNNPCRQNAGNKPEVHPNEWREDQYLVPPVATRPPRPANVTTTNGPNRTVSTATPTYTPTDTTEDAAVSRRQMERFSSLRPCLRKPCPWCEHCRQLHIPYCESENKENNNNNIPNNNDCSGICSMPTLPASNSHTNAKTNPGKITPEKKDKPTQTKRDLPSKKEEGNYTTLKVQLATEKEERQVKNQIIIRRSQGRNTGRNGEHAEETRQERQEIKEIKDDTLEKFYALKKFYKAQNHEIYLEPYPSIAVSDAIYAPKAK